MNVTWQVGARPVPRIVDHSVSALTGTSIEHKMDKLHSIHDVVNFGEHADGHECECNSSANDISQKSRGEDVEAETNTSLGVTGTF